MDEIPCITCAMAGETCCLNRQIVLTLGDINRIEAHLGYRGFFAMERPEPWYLEPSYDPEWLPRVMSSDGYLRVLKRNDGSRCGMLTQSGCILPFEVRPLVCQLHPYMHTEKEILGIDESCPISREKNGYAILERLNMPLSKAIEWQRMLYDELNAEQCGQSLMKGEMP